jgi:hypothetical protein
MGPHGKKDKSAPYHLAEAMQSGIKDSQMRTFPGDHLFFLLSRKQFIKAIVDFLDSSKLHGGFGADASVLQPEEEAPPPFRFVIAVREDACVGLGTSPRRRETVRLGATFPTEWPGSAQEVHAQVKHAWSRTLLVRHAGQGRGTCQVPPMHRTVKPKQRASPAMLSCARVQMQASDF